MEARPTLHRHPCRRNDSAFVRGQRPERGNHHAPSGVFRQNGGEGEEENLLTSAQAIKHVVVIFDENVSFDHYFATYPVAANPPRDPASIARAVLPRRRASAARC